MRLKHLKRMGNLEKMKEKVNSIGEKQYAMNLEVGRVKNTIENDYKFTEPNSPNFALSAGDNERNAYSWTKRAAS